MNLNSFFSSGVELKDLKAFISFSKPKYPLPSDLLFTDVISSYSYLANFVLILSRFCAVFSSLSFFCSGVSLNFSWISFKFFSWLKSCCFIISILCSSPSSQPLDSPLLQKCYEMNTVSTFPLIWEMSLISLYLSYKSSFAFSSLSFF